MGARGPVPNRSEDLARPRSRNGVAREGGEITKGTMRPVANRLEPDENWHPIATHLYESMASSGQADFYQDSDWAMAWSPCDDLSYYKRSTKRSGQMLQTIYSAMERLLVTEGDRRRVRIELQEAPPEADSAAVIAIATYREELEDD